MLDPHDALGRAVAARLLDFFGERTTWQRRLWTTGTIMRLQETVEAIDLLEGVPAARHNLEDCKRSARELAKIDPGVAGNRERGRIADLLSNQMPAGGSAHLQLAEITESGTSGYLKRWAAELRAGTSLGPEAVARLLASYLLDGGSSAGHLYRWWQRFAHYSESETHSLADLVELADERIAKRSETFSVLVLFEEFPQVSALPANWLDRTAVNDWLADHGFQQPDQQVGGMLGTFVARDAGSAVAQAADLLDIYRYRLTVARDARRWRPHGRAWVAGAAKPIQLFGSRRVDVPVLEREDQLFAPATNRQVDSGLHLVSLLDEGTPAAAVAGAWAGLESLLKAPGDGGAHEVAPRLALLVACSFPRSELTDLAWHHIRTKDAPLKAELRAMETNLERASRVAQALESGEITFSNPSDIAGADRIKKILQAPKREIQTIHRYADDVLRRLYRQRNSVLHSGRTDAVALPSTLRLAAPLVGAGLDRIAHGWFVDEISPLRLAAKAEMQVARLETEDAVLVTRLLA